MLYSNTVNDRSPNEFGLWAEAWSQQANIPITISPDLLRVPATRFDTLVMTDNIRTPEPDGTFLIRLQPKRRSKVTSGDLLAIYPANDHRKRLYSIGVVEKELQLSVRLHPDGLGSSFLHELTPGDTIQALIVGNDHFHFPKKRPL